MIDTDRLKELIQLMVDNNLTELDLRDDKQTVALKRGGVPAPVVHAALPPVAAQIAAPSVPVAASADASLKAIESPMVGTFYAGPNPDAPPFVKPGGTVAAGSVVCLLEAMKVFNEIKAEIEGTLERVLVKNGQAVEFGQQLFLVKTP